MAKTPTKINSSQKLASALLKDAAKAPMLSIAHDDLLLTIAHTLRTAQALIGHAIRERPSMGMQLQNIADETIEPLTNNANWLELVALFGSDSVALYKSLGQPGYANIERYVRRGILTQTQGDKLTQIFEFQTAQYASLQVTCASVDFIGTEIGRSTGNEAPRGIDENLQKLLSKFDPSMTWEPLEEEGKEYDEEDDETDEEDEEADDEYFEKVKRAEPVKLRKKPALRS